jgi:hypothetical protein
MFGRAVCARWATIRCGAVSSTAAAAAVTTMKIRIRMSIVASYQLSAPSWKLEAGG